MANIKDVAKAAGVSVSTVSKALNDYPDVSLKTRKRIRKLAEMLDYSPSDLARGLITKKSQTIGLFFGDHINSGFDHPFFTDFLRAIKDTAGTLGYDLLLFANQHRKSSSFKSICYEKGVDGVLLILTGPQRTDEYIQKLNESVPAVYIDSVPYNNTNVDFVESDNEAAAFDATEYLVGLGHRKILKIAGDHVARVSFNRINGYANALRKHGIAFDENLVVYGDFSREKAYSLTKEFFSKRQDVTAVFASSDLMAFGSIQALKELGYQVPADVSVVGFDDIEAAAAFSPALTTVHQEKTEMGEAATRMLIRLIQEDRTTPERIQIPARLVIRDSAGPLIKN